MSTAETNRYAQLFLRIALGASFLSAVADRFGLWAAHAVWGNWANFLSYSLQLSFYLPDVLTEPVAIAATVAEVLLGILLVAGVWIRIIATASAVLLALFALSMTVATGIKAPLDYSVWTACAASLLLAAIQPAVKNREENL
ncbi:MAG: DoxX family membrane protein [Mucilaginibacter polytrichastri]|nr:DoxX family membrane protein [Mucilaginibacter polytrichastri]